MSSFELNNPKKNRLGRGLESLLGNAIDEVEARPASIETSGDNLLWLEPSQLRRNEAQPRKTFDTEKLNELAASIKEKGILQPIVARRIGAGLFEIIAGERRWRASQAAGLRKVPVLIRESNDQEVLELALIENLQRDDLNSIEEAEAYRRLSTDYSLTQNEIAQKVGKDRATVANSMRLLELPTEVKTFLSDKTLSVGHAKLLLSLADSALQITLAKQIISESLSVRATEKLIAAKKISAKTPATLQPFNVDISEKLVNRIAEELQKTLGTKVTIDYSNKKGKLSIYFYSDEELGQVVEKLKGL